MKTTQKWSKIMLAGMFGMALAFGLVPVGCDDGTTSVTQYTVHFTYGRGSGTPPPDLTVNDGTHIKLPDQENMTPPTGEIFEGWKMENGSATYTPGYNYPVSKDTTFNAQWKTDLTIAPPIPTGVKATALSSSSIRISWDSVSGASKYYVYWSEDGGDYWPLAKTGNLFYEDNEFLVPETKYYYAVSSLNDLEKESDLSQGAFDLTLKAPTPAIPTGITLEVLSSTSIKISWPSVTDAANYTVYRSLTGEEYIPMIPSAETFFIDSDLSASTTYYYKVSAGNSSGNSDPSSVKSATTQAAPIQKPATPTDLTVKGSSTFGVPGGSGRSYTIWVFWSAVPDAASYNVYYATRSRGPYSLVKPNVTGTSAIIPVQSDSPSQYIRIDAENSAGTSLPTTGIEVTSWDYKRPRTR